MMDGMDKTEIGYNEHFNIFQLFNFVHADRMC